MIAHVRRVHRGTMQWWWFFTTEPHLFSVYLRVDVWPRVPPPTMQQFFDQQLELVREYLKAHPDAH